MCSGVKKFVQVFDRFIKIDYAILFPLSRSRFFVECVLFTNLVFGVVLSYVRCFLSSFFLIAHFQFGCRCYWDMREKCYPTIVSLCRIKHFILPEVSRGKMFQCSNVPRNIWCSHQDLYSCSQMRFFVLSPCCFVFFSFLSSSLCLSFFRALFSTQIEKQNMHVAFDMAENHIVYLWIQMCICFSIRLPFSACLWTLQRQMLAYVIHYAFVCYFMLLLKH